jgi:hypothetical protein
MKAITYQKTSNVDKGIKALAISSKTDNGDSLTEVKKSFSYHVYRVDQRTHEQPVPEIHITKSFDTKTNTEKFNFQVKGSFIMTQNRFFLKVDFHHTLDIQILWKKDFSPKKSAVLTK